MAAALAALAVAASACDGDGGGASKDDVPNGTARDVRVGGPLLGLVGPSGTNCAARGAATEVSIGLNSLSLQGTRDAEMLGIELITPRKVELKGAYLLAHASNNRPGIESGFPPRQSFSDIVGTPWSAAETLPSASMTPADRKLLVLHVGRLTDVGGFDGVRLTYQVGSQIFVQENNMEVVLQREDCNQQ